MTTKISVIIPVLNEETVIAQSLSALQPLRLHGHEIIVADGGSEDSSRTLSLPLADRVIVGPRGRARQMNAGAREASGEILLFLHADTFLPRGADLLITSKMKRHRGIWGRFDVRLSGKHPLFRVIENLMNWRSRLSGIATGDQAIFIGRELFLSIGGFPEIDLMEDIALSRVLKRIGPPLCLWQRVETSSRRWEKTGLLRTVLLMWRLRLAYHLGVDPHDLARRYGEPS